MLGTASGEVTLDLGPHRLRHVLVRLCPLRTDEWGDERLPGVRAATLSAVIKRLRSTDNKKESKRKDVCKGPR